MQLVALGNTILLSCSCLTLITFVVAGFGSHMHFGSRRIVRCRDTVHGGSTITTLGCDLYLLEAALALRLLQLVNVQYDSPFLLVSAVGKCRCLQELLLCLGLNKTSWSG